MRRNNFQVLLSVSLFLLVTLCYGDLPIHCLKSQVVGLWKLEISDPQTLEYPFQMNCGHEIPDNPANSYLALRKTFKPTAEFLVNLEEDFKVKSDDKQSGSWTMVYDEGINIDHDGGRFTSFFEYYPKEDGKVISYCGKTVVGWYYEEKTGKRACFRGEKQLESDSEKDKLYGEPLEQVKVVNPDYMFLQMASREKKFSKGLSAPILLQKSFKDHDFIVKELNQIPNKLWEATTYPKFKDKTLGELNQLAGRRKTGEGQRHSLKNSLLQKAEVSDLPKEFSWKEYLTPPKDQGGCGSCYIDSTLQMLEARIRIKYGKDVKLSTQHVNDCSFYNQGCEGGYPFLVAKFANEFELVPESCSPTIGGAGSCRKCDITKLDEVYSVSDYGYVGGAYGKSNERNIMEEIKKNGPIVVNFEPKNDFMNYKGGVYHSVEPEWIKKGEPTPEWERVDHSVIMYGWGETETGVKYWNLVNSWGPDWGEDGHFRMIRGVDESAVESSAEVATPIIKKNPRLVQKS